jgi:hypothetical protein
MIGLVQKFQLFEGAQNVFSRLAACVLHVTTPQPQQYKRHICGSCSCKQSIFVGIFDFGAFVLSELYGYSMPVTTFLVKN